MKKIRLIIFGGRDYEDYSQFCQVIKLWGEEILIAGQEIEVVCGACDKKGEKGVVTFVRPDGKEIYGADGLAERWASENNISIKPMEADWKQYGRSAGPIRNSEMSKYATSDENIKAHALGFWDGKSLGSSDMINKCKRVGITPLIINY